MAVEYNVFISWSGERSRMMATGLWTWLPRIIQAAKPWISGEDIAKGTPSHNEIMKAARAIKLGIVCLTEENLNAPWILFEAGALSKAVDDDGRVCTLLSPGLEPGSVEPPLSIFQATRAEKEDLRRMLSDLNAALGGPLKEPDLDGTFEAMWPKLDEAIRLEPETRPAPAKRSPDELLTEILELVRGLSRRPEGPSLSAALSGWTPSESSISPETWKTLAEIYPGIAPMGTLPLNALLLRNLGVHAHLARIPRTEPAPEPP